MESIVLVNIKGYFNDELNLRFQNKDLVSIEQLISVIQDLEYEIKNLQDEINSKNEEYEYDDYEDRLIQRKGE